MTEPLPRILAEIENSTRAANEAVLYARKAAEEVRKAGEKASKEAVIVAAEAAKKPLKKFPVPPRLQPTKHR